MISSRKMNMGLPSERTKYMNAAVGAKTRTTCIHGSSALWWTSRI